jgi:hypothetical protein
MRLICIFCFVLAGLLVSRLLADFYLQAKQCVSGAGQIDSFKPIYLRELQKACIRRLAWDVTPHRQMTECDQDLRH